MTRHTSNLPKPFRTSPLPGFPRLHGLLRRSKRPGYIMSTLLTVIAVTVLAITAGGCSRPAPVDQRVLDPKTVKSWSFDRWISPEGASTAISPDGKFMLVARQGAEEYLVSAVSLVDESLAADNASEGAPGDTSEGAAQNPTEIRLYTIPSSDLEAKFKRIGWVSETECAFLALGWQVRGPNAGKRGISIFSGDISAGKSEEISFIPLDQGYIHHLNYLPEKALLTLDTTNSIWNVDMKSKTARLIKGDLPNRDSTFQASISPDSSAYVYELQGAAGEQGVYYLNTQTGEERPLALNGDTMCFFPTWSPDGQCVAMYSVERLPGKAGTSWADYDVYSGGGGLRPVATHVVVLDRSGKTINSISLEGKVLTNFIWSPDSKSIAFAAGPRPEPVGESEVGPGAGGGSGQGIPRIIWNTVYSANALEAGTPVRLSDVDAEPYQGDLEVSPLAFDRQSKGVFYLVSSVTGRSSVWYGALDKTPIQPEEGKPVKIADGYWEAYPDIPVFGDARAAIIWSPTGGAGLWLLSPGEVKKVDEWAGNYTAIIGFNEDVLVTCEMAGELDNKVTVRSMYSE